MQLFTASLFSLLLFDAAAAAAAAPVPHIQFVETKRAAWKQFGIENGVNVFVHVVSMKTTTATATTAATAKNCCVEFFIYKITQWAISQRSNRSGIGGGQNEIKHIDTKSVALVMCAKVIYSHHHLYYRPVQLSPSRGVFFTSLHFICCCCCCSLFFLLLRIKFSISFSIILSFYLSLACPLIHVLLAHFQLKRWRFSCKNSHSHPSLITIASTIAFKDCIY